MSLEERTTERLIGSALIGWRIFWVISLSLAGCYVEMADNERPRYVEPQREL